MSAAAPHAIVLLARRLAVAPVRAYQRFLSPYTPPSCRFRPTCSAYAVEAVEFHGVFRGGWLSLRRILRCHPFTEPGNDPVPGTTPPTPSPDAPHATGSPAAGDRGPSDSDPGLLHERPGEPR